MANILVVDDQQYVRELFSEELTDEGHQIESAYDADSLMSRLQDSEHSKPDMVLLDLYLEGVKGWDLLRDIKELDPDLPVLIVTAYDCDGRSPRDPPVAVTNIPPSRKYLESSTVFSHSCVHF